MKFIGHFITITKHRHLVIRYCARVGLLWQGLRHDLSKYSPAEFIVGARFYQGDKSPNEAERAVYGYSKAWLHHKGRNKHHFEYWTDYNPKIKTVAPVEMPVRYAAEMLCDRIVASRVYRGAAYTDAYPLEYYLRGKDQRIIHPKTGALMEEWLTMLAEQGEQATLAHVRQMVKHEKNR